MAGSTSGRVSPPLAAAAGYTSVVAVPMRVAGTVNGALNLFGTPEHAAPDVPTAKIAQAMADDGSRDRERSARPRARGGVQLETALESRVAIEQAKGILAYHLDIGLDEAFVLLRHRARSQRRLLKDVAVEAINNRGGITPWTTPET